jgi:hypothetical protein
MPTYTDPGTGRRYALDPATGRPRRIDRPAPPPPPLDARGPNRLFTALGWSSGVIIVLVIFVMLASGGGSATVTAPAGAPETSWFATASPPASAAASGAVHPAAVRPSPAGSALVSPSPSPTIASVRTPVRDGQLQFVVTNVRSVHRVGTGAAHRTPRGSYLLVTVTIRNLGRTARPFDLAGQHLVDSQGHRYSADVGATRYLGTAALPKAIPPGGSLTGTVPFDVPAGTRINQVELHGSPASTGVQVRLP